MAKAALWIAAYSTMLVLRMWIFLVWAFPAIFNGSYRSSLYLLVCDSKENFGISLESELLASGVATLLRSSYHWIKIIYN